MSVSVYIDILYISCQQLAGCMLFVVYICIVYIMPTIRGISISCWVFIEISSFTLFLYTVFVYLLFCICMIDNSSYHFRHSCTLCFPKKTLGWLNASCTPKPYIFFFFKVPFYQLHRVVLIITTLTINFTPLCSFRFLHGLEFSRGS